ncbi:hypothetical protein HYV73_01410 [Candidatus Uhrbacteria bacterium]|nr:hypothetical protein [Candidatus Uhrbacteria bacterium]
MNILRTTHRPSFLFPLILIALTAVLLIAVILQVRPHPTSVVPVTEKKVDASEYRQAANATLEQFDQVLGGTSDPIVRLSATEQAREALLSLRVGADDRETHLALIVGLTAYMDALKQSRDTVSALQALSQVRQDALWLIPSPSYGAR